MTKEQTHKPTRATHCSGCNTTVNAVLKPETIIKPHKEQKPEKRLKYYWTCPHCEACRKGIAHDMFIVRRGKHDKRPAAKLDGFNKKASKNRIPPEMAEEWAKAAMARRLAAQEETT